MPPPLDLPAPVRLTSPHRLASYQTGVTASCSVMPPSGDSVRDISFILDGPPPRDYAHWYDTYDGRADATPDWYALHFPAPTRVNTLFFMHGPMFREGGWWTSLAVQGEDEGGRWRELPLRQVTPPYDLADRRGTRAPFDAYALRFDPATVTSLRLIGLGGGSLHLTSLAYLAAGMVDEQTVREHLEHLHKPRPRLFERIDPGILWDRIAALREESGIAFDVQVAEGLGLDHFLDNERYRAFHATQDSITAPDSLYNLLGSHLGWNNWGAEMLVARRNAFRLREPALQKHHGGMLWLAIPLVTDSQVWATVENRNLIGLEALDYGWHQATRLRYALDPDRYATALEAIPVYSTEEIHAIVRRVQGVLNWA